MMCDFCENIPVIKKIETYDDLLKCEDKGLAREKIILVRYKDRLNFYGFNKHCCEEDALYENIDIKFCPLCGRKLSEEDGKRRGLKMALNEIGIRFYEKKIDKLLDLGHREIIRGKFVDLQSTIDDLHVELQDRAERIAELEAELAKKETLLKMREEFCEECKEKSTIEKLKSTPLIEEPLPFSSDEYEEDFLEELRSRDLNFNLVSKMLDVIELMLTDTQS